MLAFKSRTIYKNSSKRLHWGVAFTSSGSYKLWMNDQEKIECKLAKLWPQFATREKQRLEKMTQWLRRRRRRPLTSLSQLIEMHMDQFHGLNVYTRTLHCMNWMKLDNKSGWYRLFSLFRHFFTISPCGKLYWMYFSDRWLSQNGQRYCLIYWFLSLQHRIRNVEHTIGLPSLFK